MQGEGYCRRMYEHVTILYFLSLFRAIVPFALDLITCHLLCFLPLLNLAWAKCSSSGWHCICRERLLILVGPDTQNFAIHCQGKKHGAGTSIPQKPQRQLTQFFSAALAKHLKTITSGNGPPHGVGVGTPPLCLPQTETRNS